MNSRANAVTCGPTSFAADLLEALHAAQGRALLRARIAQREHVARQVDRQLREGELAPHVDALAQVFAVPASRLRIAIGLEVGRIRECESAARGAVKGVSMKS